jgi:hypothetical protein
LLEGSLVLVGISILDSYEAPQRTPDRHRMQLSDGFGFLRLSSDRIGRQFWSDGGSWGSELTLVLTDAFDIFPPPRSRR